MSSTKKCLESTCNFSPTLNKPHAIWLAEFALVCTSHQAALTIKWPWVIALEGDINKNLSVNKEWEENCKTEDECKERKKISGKPIWSN